MPTDGMWLFPQGGSANKLTRLVVLPGGSPPGGEPPLGKYDAPTDSYVQVDALYGQGKGPSGVLGYYARACPDPDTADVALTLVKDAWTYAGHSSDNDGLIKFSVSGVPGASGRYSLSWDFEVRYDNQTGGADPGGRATGTLISSWVWSAGLLQITSDWVSPNQSAPYGSYKIKAKVIRTFDANIPSPTYDNYQQASHQITGPEFRYVTPNPDQ